MSTQIEARQGYIRAEAGLRLLDSAAVAAFNDPTSGFLDLLTDDGRLRLKLTRGAAEDLVVDLRHFLAGLPPPASI